MPFYLCAVEKLKLYCNFKVNWLTWHTEMRCDNGFSFVEVLVTLLVVTVGLLSVLAAQTLALKQVQDAIQRTHAVMLTTDVANELQLNPALNDLIGEQLNLSSPIPAITICNENIVCSSEQLAANRIAGWLHPLHNPVLSHLSEPVICLQNSDTLTINWLSIVSGVEAGNGCELKTGRGWLSVKTAG